MESLVLAEDVRFLYVTASELQRRGLKANAISQRDAKALLKSASIPQSWREVELELYPGRDGLLLFVKRSEEIHWYAFDDPELLLAAAARLSDQRESALYFMEGTYYLGLCNGGDCVAGEFGGKLPAGKYYEKYLEEHGKCLISKEAVPLLRRQFHLI